MDADLRKQPIQLSVFSDKKRYCIFAKIEEGSYISFHLSTVNITWA